MFNICPSNVEKYDNDARGYQLENAKSVEEPGGVFWIFSGEKNHFQSSSEEYDSENFEPKAEINKER
jgi:hypothetical protein